MSRCTHLDALGRVDAARRATGASCSSAAARTVPTSATVSVTVSWSRSNSARCTSRTAVRNRLVNARPPTTSEATDSMIGPRGDQVALLLQHDLVGDLLRDQRAHAVVVQRRGGAVGELVGVDGGLAHVAGDEGEDERHRGEDDQGQLRAPAPGGRRAHEPTRSASPPRRVRAGEFPTTPRRARLDRPAGAGACSRNASAAGRPGSASQAVGREARQQRQQQGDARALVEHVGGQHEVERARARAARRALAQSTAAVSTSTPFARALRSTSSSASGRSSVASTLAPARAAAMLGTRQPAAELDDPQAAERPPSSSRASATPLRQSTAQ